MRLIVIASLALISSSVSVLADSKPSADEAKKVSEALAAIGCQGGEAEKESEGTGVFEIDDADCKFGGQYDVKLDSEYRVLSITRD